MPAATIRKLIVVSSLALAALPRPAGAAVPVTDGKIAYVHMDASGPEPVTTVVVMNDDGTGATTILTADSLGSASWSPDGSQLVYWKQGSIWRMNADGTSRLQLAAVGAHPAWSPDGTEIAYSSANKIWVMDADGTDKRALTSGADIDFNPAWSPDGSRIAFDRSDSGLPRDLWVMDADGTNEEQLTGDPDDNEEDPDWSPDGSAIAFSTDRDAASGCRPSTSCNYEIYTVDPEDGSLTRITTTPDALDHAPSYSPTGDRIVHTRQPLGGVAPDIWVMGDDGADPEPLTEGPVNLNPDWQPAPTCTVTGSSGPETLNGTAGDDVICGLGGNDVLNGLGGDDILLGGTGADALIGGGGIDVLNGGAGTDTGKFPTATSPIIAKLVGGLATGQGTDRFVHVENVSGSPKADSIWGSAGPNVLTGLGGADELFGLAGDDRLLGGMGDDTLNGGVGSDTCLQGPGTGPRTGCEG